MHMHRTLGHIVGAKLTFAFLPLLGHSSDAERAPGKCREAWILTPGLPPSCLDLGYVPYPTVSVSPSVP